MSQSVSMRKYIPLAAAVALAVALGGYLFFKQFFVVHAWASKSAMAMCQEPMAAATDNPNQLLFVGCGGFL